MGPAPVPEHRTGHLDQPGLVLLLELKLQLQAQQHPQELQKDLHTKQRHSIIILLEHVLPLGDMQHMKDAFGRPSA